MFYLTMVNTKDLEVVEKRGVYKIADVAVRNSSTYISSQ